MGTGMGKSGFYPCKKRGEGRNKFQQCWKGAGWERGHTKF